MAEELPAQMSTFTVTGRLVKGVADSNDAGLQPELLPLVGATITFTPDLDPPVFVVPGATPPIIMHQETIVARTDGDGYLVGPNEITQGVVLPFGGDPDITPNGWTWTVVVSPGGNFPTKTFTIFGSPGGTYDLATLIPVPANMGEEIAYWELIRSEVSVLVSAYTDWTGAVSLAQSETKSKYIRKRLTGNTTLTLAAGETGRAYSTTLELTQDGTGGRSLVVAGAQTAYGLALPLSTAANAVDIVRLEWNGYRWAAYLSAQQLAVPSGW